MSTFGYKIGNFYQCASVIINLQFTNYDVQYPRYVTFKMTLAFLYIDLEVSFSITVIYFLIFYLRVAEFVKVKCFSHSLNVLILGD